MNITKYIFNMLLGILFLSFNPSLGMEDPREFAGQQKTIKDRIDALRQNIAEIVQRLEADPALKEILDKIQDEPGEIQWRKEAERLIQADSVKRALQKRAEELEGELAPLTLLLSGLKTGHYLPERQQIKIILGGDIDILSSDAKTYEAFLEEKMGIKDLKGQELSSALKNLKDLALELKQIIQFEFRNKSDKTIYVHLGNFNKWLNGEEWIEVKSGEAIFSIEPVTQLAYFLDSSVGSRPPDYEGDRHLNYFLFDRGESDKKVFVKLEKKGKHLVFMTQEGRAPGRVIPGKALKIGRWAGIEKGTISITQSGLSLKNSIDDKDLIWLPYPYVPFGPRLEKVRHAALLLIENYQNVDYINEVASELEKFVHKNLATFTPDNYKNSWSPLHEIYMWSNSDIVLENPNLKTAFFDIERIFEDLGFNNELKDKYGQTPYDILKSPVVKQAMDMFTRDKLDYKSQFEEESIEFKKIKE